VTEPTSSPRGARASWTTSATVGVPLGLTFAWALTQVVAKAWNACDVGVNASANSYELTLFVFPALFMVTAAVVALTLRLTPGHIVAAAVVVAELLLITWVVVAYVATPADYPDPICPGNVPAWLPSWLRL
jgi:hypothetical protein